MVVFLFVGYAQEYLAPHTVFGEFVSTWFGRIVYAFCLVVVFTLLEIGLMIVGIKFTRRNDENR
jgi:hypothetical protein